MIGIVANSQTRLGIVASTIPAMTEIEVVMSLSQRKVPGGLKCRGETTRGSPKKKMVTQSMATTDGHIGRLRISTGDDSSDRGIGAR